MLEDAQKEDRDDGQGTSVYLRKRAQQPRASHSRYVLARPVSRRSQLVCNSTLASLDTPERVKGNVVRILKSAM